MADDEKKAKKDDAKAGAEKAASKKTAKKDDAKKAPKKAAAKKESAKKAAKQGTKKEAEGKSKKAPAKKASKDKEPAKKAAPKVEAQPPVVRASARFVRVAPRKARLVADQVRGLHIEKARALLQFSPRGAARDIQKLIDSAAANAENNHNLDGEEMRVTTITVDEGPTLKRFRPRAQGRATPIHKRTSHIAVALTPVED